MPALQPFAPAYGQGQWIDVSSAPTAADTDPYQPNLRISNLNNFPVFVRVSSTAAAAVANEDFMVGPNQTSTITKGNGQGAVSVVATGTNTGQVYIQPGVGF
jgi:hypothetical protein